MREQDRPLDTALNAFLVVGLLVAVAGVGVAAATTTNGERYTELYVLGDDTETGAAVADEYPRQLEPGEEVTVRVGIGNREGSAQTYTVVVQLQRLDGSGAARRVVERTEIDRFDARLEPGETAEQRRTVEPTMTGDGLRLTYLLYVDAPPANPTPENAYRSVHVWVDVREPTAGADASPTGRRRQTTRARDFTPVARRRTSEALRSGRRRGR